MPTGKVPEGYEIAVVQSVFFEEAWGSTGKARLLIVAATLRCDVWIQPHLINRLIMYFVAVCYIGLGLLDLHLDFSGPFDA